jgi:hypothetical protein
MTKTLDAANALQKCRCSKRNCHASTGMIPDGQGVAGRPDIPVVATERTVLKVNPGQLLSFQRRRSSQPKTPPSRSTLRVDVTRRSDCQKSPAEAKPFGLSPKNATLHPRSKSNLLEIRPQSKSRSTPTRSASLVIATKKAPPSRSTLRVDVTRRSHHQKSPAEANPPGLNTKNATIPPPELQRPLPIPPQRQTTSTPSR